MLTTEREEHSPSSLPSISQSDRSSSSRKSTTLVDNVAGFMCCDNTFFHSYDPVFPSDANHAINNEFGIAKSFQNRLSKQHITRSLLFDYNFYTYCNHILNISDKDREQLLRSLIQLSSEEDLNVIRSIVISQKSKYAGLISTSQNEPISHVISNQFRWRARAAADVMNLSRENNSHFVHNNLPKNMSAFSFVTNWYHSCNGLERREFFLGLIPQLDLKSLQLLHDAVSSQQYRDFLVALPKHIVEKIIGYLDLKCHMKLSMVNHSYYQLIDTMKVPSDSTTVTRLIELDNPMTHIPSFQKAFAELQSRESYRSGKYYKLMDFDGHAGRVLSVTIYRNLLASGGSDKTVRVWSIGSGRLLCTLTGHRAGVWCLQFFSKYILFSSSYDGCIRLWSVKKGRCLRELRGHNGPVWGIKVDGNFLVSGSQDKLGIVWDAVRGEPIHYLLGHREAIFAVDICTADMLAITGSADRTVRLWSLESGEQLKSIAVGSILSITALSYSRGYIAVASGLTVKVYQVEHKSIVQQVPNVNETSLTQRYFSTKYVNVINWIEFEEEHNKRIESVDFQISNPLPGQLDGILITSSKDGHVKYWDLAQKSCIQSFKPLNGGTINSVYFDAYRVAVAGESNKVRLYDFSYSVDSVYTTGIVRPLKSRVNSKPSTRSKTRSNSKSFENRAVTFSSDS